MNHSTTHPNSSSSVPSYPQPNIQNHPFTSYHQYPPPPPPPPLPMTPGYYYSPQHQHGQQSAVSYPQQQLSSNQTQQLRQHTSVTTAQNNAWPGPPTADNTQQHSVEQMDTTSRSPSPASYAIERAASALSAFSQPQQQGSSDSKSDDPLLSLARAASFQDSLTTGSPPMSLSTSPSPSSSPTMSLNTPSAGPLKKRRKVLGIEKEDDQTKKSQANEDDDKKLADSSKNLSGGESNSPSLVPSLAWSSKSSSVEEMNTSSNKSNSMSGQFPIVLHKLLSKIPEGNNSCKQDANNKISSAMEWLNHGKSFRILRYDILCTEVLPKEMPMLCSDRKKKMMQDGICKSESRDDETKAEGEEREQVYSDDEWVEAFSWFVKSYGFEEVMSGREKGSFRHEFFTRDSPELCNKMKLEAHSHSAVMNNNNSTQLTPTFSTVKMIGTPPRGLNISPEQTTTVWRSTNGKSSRGGISSIFKPRSNSINSTHPSHLNVPMLSSTNTASFAESWLNGGTQHQYQAQGPYPPRPPLTRSPKTIRFRDETDNRDDAIEISTQNNREVSPSPHHRGRKQLSSISSPGLPPRGSGSGSGFVSRRGRRPPMISRHSTH